MKHHRFTNSQGTITVRDCDSGGIFKSRLESLGFIRAYLGPDVASVHLQSPVIRYTDVAGKRRRYTGDLHVRFQERAKRRPLVIECKYEDALQADPALVTKLKHVGREFDGLGFDFCVQTEKIIKAADLLMMRFVFDHGNLDPHPVSKQVMDCMRVHKTLSLEQLIKTLGLGTLAGYEIIPEVWRLVACRQLAVDFKEILNLSAKIHMPSV
jgi:hypothetical protein